MYVLEESVRRRSKCDVATAERKRNGKENKTVQEKKVQRMVNDLIKMAERRGATYYGSWIEDERQYVAGAHFVYV